MPDCNFIFKTTPLNASILLILNTYQYLCNFCIAGFICCIYFTVLIWYAILPNNKYIYIFMQFSSYFTVPFPYTKSHTQHGILSCFKMLSQYLYYEVDDDWEIWIGKDFKRNDHHVCMYVWTRVGQRLALAPRPLMIYCASPFD
jgi:hypothetical protein